MNKFYLKISTVFLIVASIITMPGCDMPGGTSYTTTTTAMMIIPQAPNTMWDKIAANMTFKSHQDNPRVQRFIKQYSRENYYQLITISKQASPYLYHVVKLLEERGLPPELALLPMIESEYRATATSKMGAVGLWQLVSNTSRLYGLKNDQWYDGRRDPSAATKVAMGHLEYLYGKFNHDWLLALAAYNAGDGRVSAAIRFNKKHGRPTDYWSLNLPQETQYFVPKFLALVYLIKNNRNLDIDLAPIANKPYFDKVQLSKQIALDQAAKLAEVDLKEVKRLNPALRTHMTHPNGPHELALPVQNVSTFKANFNNAVLNATAKPKVKTKPVQVAHNTVTGTIHTVHKGDTLHLIATKYSTTVQSIKHKNKLTSDIIRSGQKLII